MPIYEYEPADHDCLMCEGRVAVIQGIEEAPLQYCPDCGLSIRKIVSNASFAISRASMLDKAGERGFTTWKKSEEGKWEKVSGQGADQIVVKPSKVKEP